MFLSALASRRNDQYCNTFLYLGRGGYVYFINNSYSLGLVYYAQPFHKRSINS